MVDRTAHRSRVSADRHRDELLDEGAPWARRTRDGWSLTVRVQPGAKRSEVAGVHGDALRVRVRAPAADGRANAELVRHLAEVLALPERAVEVARGHTSRTKTVRVATGGST